MAPLVRTGGSRHTGLAALPHRNIQQVEVSIHELLAAAREAVKSDYIKGESILCETRYHPDTHYMVEIEMLKTDMVLCQDLVQVKMRNFYPF